MICDKCGTQLEQAKAYRSSGCLVGAGFLLLGTSLVAVPLAILFGIGGAMGTGRATSAHLDRARSEALERFEGISDLPPGIVADFRDDGLINEESVRVLPLEQRQAVRRVVIDYGVAVGSAGAAGVLVGGAGTFLVVALLVFGIPGTIVGLLLVRRRKLWRCAACGHASERL